MNKFWFFLDFGQGLFGEERIDLEISENFDNYKIPKNKSVANYEADELKEIELKSAMFNAVQEDIYFSLD